MKVEAGRYYQNTKGLVRKVERIEWAEFGRHLYEAAFYRSVSAVGVEGPEKFCAISTMNGWARREFDPDALGQSEKSAPLTVKVKRTSPDVNIPQYATPGAAAFDLHAASDGLILPGEVVKVPLGLAFEIPPGHALIIAMRSGIGFKTSLRQPNGIGVIDSDYRGEVAMLFDNTNGFDYDEDGELMYGREVLTLDGGQATWDIGQVLPVGTYLVRKGERVAQGFVLPLPAVTFTEVEELSETERGTGGFGSTGTLVSELTN